MSEKHINTEYIPIMSRKYGYKKHLAVAVLCIIRHLHIGKKDTKKRKNLSRNEL